MAKGHIPGNALIVLVSSLLALVLISWQLRSEYAVHGKRRAIYLLAGISIIGASTFAVSKIYDKSWDGLTYHQMAILDLVDGWNPFYEKLPDASFKSLYTGRTENMNLYVNHYAKGAETFAATVIAATENVESGKVYNVLLILAAFCSVLYVLTRLNLFTGFWNFMIAAAAALNPIAVNQTFSYLVDGALSSVLLMLVCNFALLLMPSTEHRRGIYIHIFFLILLIINLKFTGAVYLGWFCLAFIFLSVYLKKLMVLQQFAIVIGLSGVVAVCFVGFNPYMRNVYDFGHPFHPIAGNQKVDVIASVMPPEFQTRNSFQKFVSSTFSACDNFDSVQPDRTVRYKLPFTFTTNEIKIFQSETTRLCGFGVLWSGILCLSIVCTLVLVKSLPGRALLYFMPLLFAALLSVAVNPESWWARLVPQLWLFPLIVCVFLMTSQVKVQRTAGKITLILLITNSLIVASAYTYSNFVLTLRANQYFEALKTRTEPVFVYFDIFTPNMRKFEDKHIRFVRVHDEACLPCENKVAFLNMRLCAEDNIKHLVDQ